MAPTSAVGQSVELLLYITEFLNERSIKYAAIGALAGAFLGSVRASIDADALILLAGKPDVFVTGLKAWKGAEGLSIVFSEPDLFDPVRGVVCIRDSFGNQVDLLLGIRGVGKDALERAKEVALFSKTLKVVCAEDFIAMKIFAGSALDLEDAANIIAVQKEALDIELINRLVAPYGEEELQKLKRLMKAGTP